LQVIKTDAPRKVIFGEYSTIVLSDTSVLFAGMDQLSSSRDGKTIELPARFTLLVTKGNQGWRISHFDSSARPGSP
jgi:ketosteroid isomerase-like protein